jgi:hypothetical protein
LLCLSLPFWPCEVRFYLLTLFLLLISEDVRNHKDPMELNPDWNFALIYPDPPAFLKRSSFLLNLVCISKKLGLEGQGRHCHRSFVRHWQRNGHQTRRSWRLVFIRLYCSSFGFVIYSYSRFCRVVLAARSQDLNDVVSECSTRARKKGLMGDRAIGILTNVTSEADCKCDFILYSLISLSFPTLRA